LVDNTLGPFLHGKQLFISSGVPDPDVFGSGSESVIYFVLIHPSTSKKKKKNLVFCDFFIFEE
jgi:hypothetical protein